MSSALSTMAARALRDDRGSRPDGRPPLIVSCLLHAGLIGAACALVIDRPRPAPQPASIMLAFQSTEAMPAAAPSEIQLPAAAVQATPRLIAAPLPETTERFSPPAPARHAGSPHMPLPAPFTDASDLSTRFQSPQVPVQPAAPEPAQTEGLFKAWQERVRAAVQAAAIYPPAARLQHRVGRTQIRFALDGSAVIDVTLAASSQSRLLDQAALDAVRRAVLPAAPPALAGRIASVLVWVNFRLD